ncbi:DUF294 nucleotidyltransferase-like domain-containing protein [Thalassolituus oleivorans]|uniref:DUF294 nucleotidyltransferase-like domain-containing protein n=1 Tax=Thalassolituus oleivorans TaxID=187493 RepID=UPI00240912A7|nr:DUF294 nucleotidyltransferase-like domain-containing protein [Thalassolituus oleivorans]MDF1642000.1 DUF294 nucleotidyltransferase-like domain-containing protein [Thalassolituus oleivorans]
MVTDLTMSIELPDIERAMTDHEPFCWLPADALSDMARSIEVSYKQAGEVVLALNEPIHHLYFVRSGEVEIYRRDGSLYNRLPAGHVFGQMGLLMNAKVRFPATTRKDSLFYLIPIQLFMDYCEKYSEFGDFFEVNEHSILEQAIQVGKDDMTTVPVTELITAEPLVVTPDTTVAECAIRISENYIAAAVVQDEHGVLLGIVTDSDLRARVIAKSLPYDTPVGDIMSTELLVMDQHAYLHEVMLVMLRNNTHHVPIMDDQRVLGVVSLLDVVAHESQNSLLLVRSILSSESIDSLAQLSKQLPSVYERLVNEHAKSHMIGSAMSVIGASFMQQMAKLVEDELGPPPVPYCLIALGSLARDEQLLVTDQDNALILSDDYHEVNHGAYFEQFSNMLCEGLDRCGYPLCEGLIMASNPKWRMRRSEWRDQFTDWIENPDPKALLNASIFFDLVAVHGKKLWAKELQKFIATKAKNSKPFLASLARNALKRTPPLGVFKNFVLEEDGRQQKSLNIKRRGTAPLTDIIRVHALATGSILQNSFERLDDISKTKLLPNEKYDELTNALELLYSMRAREQMLAIREKREPNNNIAPDTLSLTRQRSLKEAFNVITQAQRFLKYRYTANG